MFKMFTFHSLFDYNICPDLTAPAEPLLVSAPLVTAPGTEHGGGCAGGHRVTPPPGPPGARPAPRSWTQQAALVLRVHKGDWTVPATGLYQGYFGFC